MTIIMLDIPEQVLAWYADKADEMRETGSRMTRQELMENTLFLHTAQAPRLAGPGAAPRAVNPPFTPNTYSQDDEYAHPRDFPSGGGY